MTFGVCVFVCVCVCMFSKFINFVQIDLKIGTHIDLTYTMYLAKKYVSMATKYPIIKHRAFFKTFNSFHK